VGTYVLRRALLLVPTLFGLSVVAFVLMRLLPGDVMQVMIGPELIRNFPPEQQATLRRMFGIDVPIYVQYLRWIGAVARGDLGVSLRTSTPVARMLLLNVRITAELAFLAALVATLLAVPLGVLAAVRRNGIADFVAHVVGLAGLSFPNFLLATLLLLVTSLYLRWQPPPTWVSPFQDPRANLQQMLLPTLSLSLALVASTMRMTRSSMLEVLDQDYIRTARAKGQAERVVILGHALKNALIPVITVIGIQIGDLLGGTVIIEQIFGLPGIGWLTLNAIYQRDYPTIQGAILFVAVVFVVVNLIVDVFYAFLDPRIRYA
jgi:peptide/nickel transport system permease protein